MIPVLMGIAGLAVGVALDAAIARLAREPYEDAVADEPPPSPDSLSLGLASEAGTLRMPGSLTTGADYRRVIVVAVTALLFAAVGYQYQDHAWQMAVVAVYVAVLIVCTGTDYIAHRIPNIVTYPAIAGALAVGLLAPDANRLDVLLGGAVGAGPLFVMFLLTSGAMGFGDVKLALFTGLALGLTLIIPAMLVMALTGGLVATLLLVARLRSRRDGIPYGPYIAIGAMLVMLLQGTAIIDL